MKATIKIGIHQSGFIASSPVPERSTRLGTHPTLFPPAPPSTWLVGSRLAAPASISPAVSPVLPCHAVLHSCAAVRQADNFTRCAKPVLYSPNRVLRSSVLWRTNMDFGPAKLLNTPQNQVKMFLLDRNPSYRLEIVQISRAHRVLPSQVLPAPRYLKVPANDNSKQFVASLRGIFLSRKGQRQLRGGRPQGRRSRCSGQATQEPRSPSGYSERSETSSLVDKPSSHVERKMGWNGTRESRVAPLNRISRRPMAKVFVCPGSPLSRMLVRLEP